MNKFLNFLDNIEENIITILLPLMCVVVFLSTFFRYTEILIIPWGEELARYLMVWIVFLGLGTGAKRDAHFRVQALTNLLPESAQKVMSIFRVVVVSCFLAFIVYLSINIMQVQAMMGQVSPSLHIPMWVAYLAIPVGCTAMILRSIQRLIQELRGDFNVKDKEV